MEIAFLRTKVSSKDDISTLNRMGIANKKIQFGDEIREKLQD